MSLSLIQGYSSAEEEVDATAGDLYTYSSDDDDAAPRTDNRSLNDSFKPLFDPPQPSSSLPSALDAFSEIAGPPQFLNNSVEEPALPLSDGSGQPWRHGRRRNRHKDKKDLPSGGYL